MLINIYTVYDDKAEMYLAPFYFGTVGEALRAFGASVNDPNHSFCKHSEDYTMFELGTYDNSNAKFETYLTPKAIGKAIELKINRLTPAEDLRRVDLKGSV